MCFLCAFCAELKKIKVFMKRYSILQRYKSRGNLTWYGRISDGGLVRYVSLGVTRKADAQEWLNQQNARKFIPDALLEEKRDRRIQQSINAFMDYVCNTHGPDSQTYKAYGTKLKNLMRWCERYDVSTLRDFNREKASRFSSSVCSDFAPKTAREIIRVSKQFCKWAGETFEIDDWNPMSFIKAPKIPKRKKDFWTPEQVDKILDAAPSPEFRLFWALMAFSGLRQAEACSFGASSITEEGMLHVIGKGDKEAFLPISNRLKYEIELYGKISDGMFDKPDFKYSRSNDTLREAVDASGIVSSGKSNNHRFRHSFASNLLRASVPVPATARLMRHSDATTTLSTYSHLLQEDLSDAANALK